MENKNAKQSKVGELRRSQLITTFGPGAIVDFPKFSGIVSGIDMWNIDNCKESEDLKIYEHSLTELLGHDYFIQPVSENDNKSNFSIPVYQFPTWYYCPSCGRLAPYWEIGKPKSDKDPTLVCNKCSAKRSKKTDNRLVPSRFIVACANGHLDDFPYRWWVHRGYCEKDAKDIKLKLTYDANKAGLDGIIISCLDKDKCNNKACRGWRSMAGCMNQDALKDLACFGKMPWVKVKAQSPTGKDIYKAYEEKDCKAQLRTLQRTANNVYYSVTVSALTIPPWSEDLRYYIQKNKNTIEKFKNQFHDEWLKNSYVFLDIEQKFHINIELYRKVVDECFAIKDITIKDIIKNEYIAFCQPDTDHKCFKTKKEEIHKDYTEYIEDVKLVKRLREVQVLEGFRRIYPEQETNEDKRKELGLKAGRNFTPIFKDDPDWLPAVELFGEGIFIKLNQNKVDEWGKNVGSRYDLMKQHIPFEIANGMFSPQYVLLHTLSHLLIRQLAYSCGYNTTSIKEKIYSTFEEDTDDPIEKMCGILIYTAATDCDGSLGGLVREGTKSHLKNLFDEMLDNAYWCSNDPICINSTAQGYNSLNYAACHACTLLPETSCVARNCLLDRAAITGTPDNRNIAFFKDKIEG